MVIKCQKDSFVKLLESRNTKLRIVITMKIKNRHVKKNITRVVKAHVIHKRLGDSQKNNVQDV